MNNNNVFYELREISQRNISLKKDNGNYNINFKKPLILNEGDELLINKTVIDTRSIESDKIILDNDINIKINVCYYLLNDNTLHKINPNGDIPWANSDLDYELYILGVPTGSGEDTKIYELKEVQYLNAYLPGKSTQWQPWTTTFEYTDLKTKQE